MMTIPFFRCFATLDRRLVSGDVSLEIIGDESRSRSLFPAFACSYADVPTVVVPQNWNLGAKHVKRKFIHHRIVKASSSVR